jgi:hypothetical protein
VHHLCARTGFTKIGEVVGYRMDPRARAPSADIQATGRGVEHASSQSAQRPEAPSPFERVRAEEIDAATLLASTKLGHSGGLMDSGWRFSRPDRAQLLGWAAGGRLHWWRGRRGLLATREDEEDSQPVLAIAFGACASADLADLLMDAGSLAAQQSVSALHWLAPVAPAVQRALDAAAFFTDWDSSGYLYEKPYPGE